MINVAIWFPEMTHHNHWSNQVQILVWKIPDSAPAGPDWIDGKRIQMIQHTNLPTPWETLQLEAYEFIMSILELSHLASSYIYFQEEAVKINISVKSLANPG